MNPVIDASDWKRPFKNARKLLLGRGAQGVMSLLYTSLSARALGVEGFGILTLVYSSVMVLRGLLGFRSWQVVLKFGSEALVRKDRDHLLSLVSFALIIETVAGLLGAIALWFFSEEVLQLFKIPLDYTHIVRCFAAYLFVWILSDVGLGILRLFDRHDLISWQLTVEPLVRLVGSIWFFLYAGSVMDFLWLWLLAGLASKIFLIILSLRTLRLSAATYARRTAPIPRGFSIRKMLREPERGVWSYAFGTYVQSALATNFAPMLIASQLGPAGAGIWRVAQRVVSFMSQPVSKLLVPAFYTDISWLQAAGDSDGRSSLVLKTGAIAGLATVVVAGAIVVFGEWIVEAIFGSQFVDAYEIIVILSLGPIIAAFTFGVPPMMMAAGRVWQTTSIRVFVMIIYFITIVPLIQAFGIAGAAVATLFSVALTRVLMIYFCRDLIFPKQRKG